MSVLADTLKGDSSVWKKQLCSTYDACNDRLAHDMVSSTVRHFSVTSWPNITLCSTVTHVASDRLPEHLARVCSVTVLHSDSAHADQPSCKGVQLHSAAQWHCTCRSTMLQGCSLSQCCTMALHMQIKQDCVCHVQGWDTIAGLSDQAFLQWVARSQLYSNDLLQPAALQDLSRWMEAAPAAERRDMMALLRDLHASVNPTGSAAALIQLFFSRYFFCICCVADDAVNMTVQHMNPALSDFENRSDSVKALNHFHLIYTSAAKNLIHLGLLSYTCLPMVQVYSSCFYFSGCMANGGCLL